MVDRFDFGARDADGSTPQYVRWDAYRALAGDLELMRAERDALKRELALLSDKACAAVYRYRQALQRLTDSFKYSTEVVSIAREALSEPATTPTGEAE